MADFVFFYADAAERVSLATAQNALSRRTKSDDFIDVNGNPTNGTSGRLTFTDDAEVGPPPKVNKTTEVFSNESAANNEVILTDSSDVLGESSYAEISNDTPGPQQTTINTTYTKIDQFDTIGLSKNLPVSGANNNLTILIAGTYSIYYSMSFSGTADETYVIAIHDNDVEVTKSATVRKLGTGGDVGNVSSKCILQLAVDDIIDVRVRTVSVGPNNFTLQTGNFIIEKVR